MRYYEWNVMKTGQYRSSTKILNQAVHEDPFLLDKGWIAITVLCTSKNYQKHSIFVNKPLLLTTGTNCVEICKHQQKNGL
jgi:hypothetical protein